MASYDVIIIGAGPGGYVSAIRCAQLGLKTAVVEGRDTLGGTCLNVGCIPSKALLNATHHLHEAEHNFATMGLKGKTPSVDWDQMKTYKSDVVGQNTGGIEFLFKKNKIDWIKGWASIPAAGQVKVGDDVHEMGAAVQNVDVKNKKANVQYKLRKDDSDHAHEADVVLVATGRKPFTDGLGLAELGVEMSERGQIKTNAHWATNVAGIYAIGDAIDGPMLAHKAEDEGMAVAEVLAGKHGHVNYDVIPGVVYTSPEVATVGKTEAQLKEEGRKIKVGKFSFMGNARAKAVFQGDGFVKIIADAETDRVLGAAIIGPAAGDMIHELCVAMEYGGSAQDIALTCHAHPTYSEAVREAALALGDGAIHA